MKKAHKKKTGDFPVFCILVEQIFGVASEYFCEFGGCIELKLACGAFSSFDTADDVDVNARCF